MKHLTFLCALLPVALGLSSCGGPDKQAAMAQIRALVPADAVAFLQLSSIDDLDDKVTEMELALGGSGNETEINQLISLAFPLIGSAAQIDRARPMAVALSMSDGAPAPFAIVPALDSGVYVDTLVTRPAPPVIAGDYVVVPMTAAYTQPTAPAAITEGLPDALLTGRFKVAEIVTPFRPMIEGLLAAAPQMYASQLGGQLTDQPIGFDFGQMIEVYLDPVRALLDSADTIDFSLSIADGHLSARASIQVLPGSSMAGWADEGGQDLSELAGRLDPDDAIRVVAAGDLRALVSRTEPFYEKLALVYPEEMRDMFSMEKWLPLYERIGNGIAISAGLSDDGIEGAAYFQSADAGRLLEDWLTLAAEHMGEYGIGISEPSESELDGARLVETHVDFDWDTYLETLGVSPDAAEVAGMEDAMGTMFGEDGLRVRFLLEGQQIGAVIAGDDASAERALARMREPAGTPPPSLLVPIDSLRGASPSFVYEVDMAKLVQAMADFSDPATGQPVIRIDPDASATMLFYGGVSGREWRGGFSFDLGGLGRAIQVR